MKSLFYLISIPFSALFKLFSGNLRVLAYHTVPNPQMFADQLLYLKRNYNIISMEELQYLLLEGKVIPRNSLVITFDDGDISLLHNGVPELVKKNIPATIFIITALINSTQTFWCRWVEIVMQKNGETYLQARKKVKELKNVPEKLRKEFLESLEPIESVQLKEQDLMNFYSSNIFIGNHTHTHPMINNCTSEELEWELESAKLKFEEWELPGYSIFAYPNGNWDMQAEKVLKQKGIKLAFLFDHKINRKEVNPLRISRIMVSSNTELHEFKAKVSGFHTYLMRLKSLIK